MPINGLDSLKDKFVESLNPLAIYVFGSRVNGTYTQDSDVDFYIIVDDSATDLAGLTTKAYKSIRSIKEYPVDIVIGTQTRFNTRKGIPSLENEVYNKGALVYEA